MTSLGWLAEKIAPPLIVAAILAVLVGLSGVFHDYVRSVAASSFPSGTVVLTSKHTPNCPEAWIELGEVSILGNPGATMQLEKFAEARDGAPFGYTFDYFRFMACGKP